MDADDSLSSHEIFLRKVVAIATAMKESTRHLEGIIRESNSDGANSMEIDADLLFLSESSSLLQNELSNFASGMDEARAIRIFTEGRDMATKQFFQFMQEYQASVSPSNPPATNETPLDNQSNSPLNPPSNDLSPNFDELPSLTNDQSDIPEAISAFDTSIDFTEAVNGETGSSPSGAPLEELADDESDVTSDTTTDNRSETTNGAAAARGEAPANTNMFVALPEEELVFTLPESAASTNKAFERGLESAQDSGSAVDRICLFVGKLNVAAPVLIFLVDIFFGKRTPATYEATVAGFGKILGTTMEVIKRAKGVMKLRKDKKVEKDYSSANPDLPLAGVMQSFENKEENESDASHDELAVAAKEAFEKAKMGDWASNSKLGTPMMNAINLIGHSVATFRVLSMISFARFKSEIGGGDTENKKLKKLENLCTAVLGDVEITSYTMLEVYEYVLVKAVHNDSLLLAGLEASDFVCMQISNFKYIEEWRIAEQVPLSMTLTEAGGIEAIRASIEANRDFLLSYFTNDKQGSKRRRRATRIATHTPAASRLLDCESPEGFVFSVLCGTVSMYERHLQIVLNKKLHLRDGIDAKLAKEFEAVKKSIVKYAEKSSELVIPVYADITHTDNAEEVQSLRLELVRTFNDNLDRPEELN